MIALRLLIYGFAVLLVAILANAVAWMLGWSTWYDYLGAMAGEGIVPATLSLTAVELGFLFFIYPIILGLPVYLFVRVAHLP
ncbi:MAG: hypothetical protein R6U92_03360 [Bacillota bacterium]